jgi:hypothetical protein
MNKHLFIHTLLILSVTLVLFALLVSPSAPASSVGCVAPPPNLVSWWPGDGNAKDIIGVNDGILGGNTTFDTGMVAAAFEFDGVGDYIQVLDTGQGNLDGFSQVTINAWINHYSLGWTNPNTGGYTSAIASKYNSSQATGVSYYLNLENGKLRMAVFQNVNPISMALVESVDVIAINTWSHVAGVWSGGSEIELYINGTQVETTPLHQGPTPSIMASNDVPVNIGRIESFSGLYPGPAAYFHGLIDEASIFDRALSTDEIQMIFNAGSEGKCKDNINPTPTPSASSPYNYLPVVVKPFPTPTATPTSLPSPTPTPRPNLQDGTYLADFGGNGSLWFTVSNNGTLASNAGYSFYHGAPWCGWNTHSFDGSVTINNGAFAFSYVLRDENHFPIYYATMQCESNSTTQATCQARDLWVALGPCSIEGVATLR